VIGVHGTHFIYEEGKTPKMLMMGQEPWVPVFGWWGGCPGALITRLMERAAEGKEMLWSPGKALG
jgi:hypothetical protein